MAIRTKDELIDALLLMIGDEATDEQLTILEDVTDTLTDYETRTSEDWKAKYDELDKTWRKRYTDRFSGGGDSGILAIEKPEAETVVTEEPEDSKLPTTYEELFEEIRV